eukprot:CAMPEP_0172935850 /NCGR_PEP_ID=MMETSP1075-20121228/221722_1 /TAXON_ID=2916 /ORGANISM="Ceratium fusus, Strain PA161109" /LENGTH=452 /DNA_ID=CAMNT_0013797211 /DNA_START=15 /DNA_END=1374 /DNA_ORIENTATION=-
MTFQDDELSYALGKQGSTRKKLERASQAIVQYVGHVALFSGTRHERRRAKEYMKWLFGQLEGPVYVTGWEDRDDCTVVHVPSSCIGYVTGNRRATLGRMEEAWGTLMFFMTKDGDKGGRQGWSEQLIIFGNERGRRGAELKCMNEIERKAPGTFTKGLREKITDTRGFDTDRICIKEDELSYVIGKEAATQKKLETAAGSILQFVGRYAFIAGSYKERKRCKAAAGSILQFVGRYAFIAGSYKERKRCKEYIGWLLQQLRSAVTIADVSSRDDCTEMHIPMNCKGWVTGNRGSELRRMEQETGVFMFMALDGRGEERLIIFSHDAGSKTSANGRMAAERLVNELVQEKLRDDGDVTTLVPDPTRGQLHHPVAVQIHGAASHHHRPAATVHGQTLPHHEADLLWEEVIARHHAVAAQITTAGVVEAAVAAETIHGAGQGDGESIPSGSLRMPT